MRKTAIRKHLILLAAWLLLGTPFSLAAQELNVTLFPYIPDAAYDNFQRLKTILANQFMRENPGTKVNIDINPGQDLYSIDQLGKLLKFGPDRKDIVEVDTILLGDLQKNKLVQDLTGRILDLNFPDILPSAQKAVTVEEKLYGFPTYLCTNVVYAYDKSLTSVHGGGSLLFTLTRINSNNRPLVGNYAGSWTLSSTYIDAYVDTNFGLPDLNSGQQNLDPMTMQYFMPLVKSCELQTGVGRINPCLNGSYKDNPHQAEADFATNRANGFFGFTERLFFIRRINPTSPLYVISAPMGLNSFPVMFVDALVVSPECKETCLDNAIKFIQFMGKVETRNLIAFSWDALGLDPTTPPRYLLQASKSFYSSEPAIKDPFYLDFWGIVNRALAFPNQGLNGTRRELEQKLKAALSPPQKN